MLAGENKVFTYKDYLTYDENERIEIIDGEVYNMCPAPSRIHQKIIMELAFEFKNYIKSKNGSCEVYPAPFDVILINDNEDINISKNVVQPDISIICDKSKLTDKGCTGSPNIIIEVISPFNPSNDYIRKAALYEKFKVQEYWIVNPIKKNILVYNLIETGYDTPNIYSFEDTIPVSIFKDLNIDFSSLDLT